MKKKKLINKKLDKILKNLFNFNDPKYIYILAAIVFLVALGLLGWFLSQTFFGNNYDDLFDDFVEEQLEEEKGCDYKRKLDGVCVELEKYVDPELVAVMVENNLEAWPLSGIADANVVYEAPVEGNIPRYMAVYTIDTKIEQVGPVRSARPYYLDWVSEYGNAMYMHVGGSPDALDLIDIYNLFDINEFYRGWYFWRSNGRDRPHNTYTSNKLWEKAYEDYSEYNEKEDYDGWVFEKMASCVEDCVEEIEVPMVSWGAYRVVWKFNTSTQQYTRFQGADQAFDMDGAEIVADTIIVQRVRAKIIDEVGRREIGTIGSGDVAVFRNGKVIEGKWFKESRKDRTRWYDEENNLIPLQAGKIWVEILPEDKELKWE